MMILVSIVLVSAPQKVSWETLAKVKFTKQWNADEGMYVLYPEFSAEVKALDGKEIVIMGYVIPVDYSGNIYVLSANPYSSCFFCGGAGPETVMSLKFKTEGRSFKTDERLSFKGVLKLNSSDIYEMNYILKEAEVYEP